ncbi:MAG: FlgD immunoglobulin-like domain containing protein [bacterium]
MIPSSRSHFRSVAIALATLAVSLVPPRAVAGSAEAIYYADRVLQQIYRCDLDGTNVQLIVDAAGDVEGLDVDLVGEKIYWADAAGDEIGRCNLDGSGREGFQAGLPFPTEIVVLGEAGLVFWIDPSAGGLFRRSIDGGPATLVATGAVQFALDPVRESLWYSAPAFGIRRSSLDGSGIVSVSTSTADAMVVDPVDGTLYFCKGTEVRRRPRSGGEQILATSGSTPFSNVKSMDLRDGVLYYADWSANGRIWSSPLDASAFTEIFTSSSPRSLAVPEPPVSPERSIYWGSDVALRIGRTDLDHGGSSVGERIYVEIENVAVDLEAGHVYYAGRTSSHVIGRMNLDGSDVQVLMTGFADVRDLVLDLAAGKIYWSETGADQILRANLDGTDVETVIVAPSAGGLAFDPLARRLYWTERHPEELRVRGMDVDGSTPTTHVVILTSELTGGLTIDVVSRVLYVSIGSLSPLPGSLIAHVELDTGTTGYFLTSESGVVDVEVSGGHLYWIIYGTDPTFGGLYRSDPDGANVTELAALQYLRGLAVPTTRAAAQRSLYWTSLATGEIRRTSLDGLASTPLVSGLQSPPAVEVDLSGGKIYWTDFGTDKIQRANLDGSGIEDLVTTGLQIPDGLALDVAAGKMYWSDRGTDKIQRANLDGTGLEDLVTSGLTSVSGLALEIAAGRMYWAEGGVADGIYVATLDGTDIGLIQAAVNPTDVAIDEAAGMLYWTESGRVRRASVSGGAPEDVAIGLGNPRYVDVDEGWVYWTDSTTGRVQRADTSTLYVQTLFSAASPYGCSVPDFWNVVAAPDLPTAPRISLAAPAPNPFRADTRVRFALDREGPVSLVVHDVAGRRVRTLLATDRFPAGAHEILWDGRNQAGATVANGVYLLRLDTGEAERTRKVTHVR